MNTGRHVFMFAIAPIAIVLTISATSGPNLEYRRTAGMRV
jgi:hypothetical protein